MPGKYCRISGHTVQSLPWSDVPTSLLYTGGSMCVGVVFSHLSSLAEALIATFISALLTGGLGPERAMRFGTRLLYCGASLAWKGWVGGWTGGRLGLPLPGSPVLWLEGRRSSLLAWEARNQPAHCQVHCHLDTTLCSPKAQLAICKSCHWHWGGTCLFFSVPTAQLMRAFVKFLIMASMPGLIICIWLL